MASLFSSAAVGKAAWGSGVSSRVTFARGSTDKRLPLALTPLTAMNSFKLNLCSPKSLALQWITGAPWAVKSSKLDPSDSPMNSMVLVEFSA